MIVFNPAQSKTDARTNFLSFVVPEFSETPALIKSEIKVSEMTNIRASKGAQLSIAEIRGYLQLHPQLTPAKRAQLLTQLHGASGRAVDESGGGAGGLALRGGVGAAERVCGVWPTAFSSVSHYFILMKFGLALGTGGYIPPWLAAWFPNGFFGGLGLWLTQRSALKAPF